MTDDFDDDDLGDPDATGRAALLCWIETLGCRIIFADSVEAALHLAARQPCPVDGCLGGHAVVYRDDRDHLSIVPDTDGDEVVARFNKILRVREARRQARNRANEARRQQRRRAAKRSGGSDVVPP